MCKDVGCIQLAEDSEPLWIG